jgi:hypothetical protein
VVRAADGTADRISLGRELVRVRASLPKRSNARLGWGHYLETRGLNESTARRYMRLAKHVDAGHAVTPVSRLDRTPTDQIAGVYFVQGTNGGPIKIGESADVRGRLRDLQACSPVLLRLLGVVVDLDDRRAEEQGWHARFASTRLHGEWFEATPALLAAISVRAREI